MAHYDSYASSHDTGQYQQQPGGLFSMNVPGMMGAARTMTSMQVTSVADPVSLNSMELRSVSTANRMYDEPTTPGIGSQQLQQQPNTSGDGQAELEADYDEDSDDNEDLAVHTSGPPKPGTRSCDTETMTINSDATSSNNIRFRVDDGDGERSLSDESGNQEGNLMEADDMCVHHAILRLRSGFRSFCHTFFV